MPDAAPTLPDALFGRRFAEFRRRWTDAGYDAIVVYADREHSANLSYLIGFDPRFEEALLVDTGSGMPLLLTGNECVGMADAAPLPMRVELYQEFSLPSQPRDSSRNLVSILTGEDVGSGSRIGAIGWKESADRYQVELPAFVVDACRLVAGGPELVENAGDLLTGAANGMRIINEPEQLAAFEYAACHTSEGVKRLIHGLEPGLREDEAVQLLQWNGSPLSCHLMLTAGPRAAMGLLSPSDRRMQRGEPFTTAFGIWGALNCRAGWLVADASELPDGVQDYVERLVVPYFSAIVEWYEALHIGQTGGALFEIIDRHLGDPFFGIFLNPGHQIHLDEWVNSPVWRDSPIELASGMAMQVDVIPATGTEYFTTNIEDGIALLDAAGRTAFAASHPAAWDRVTARRAFMADHLGIDLHPDVLPFSNIPAYLAPFLLSPERVMVAT